MNNNDPIKKSRDTTELPGDMGYEIANMFTGGLLVSSYNETHKHLSEEILQAQGGSGGG